MAFFLNPEGIMSPFGIQISEELKNNAQLYGISMIAIAFLAWSSRNATSSETRRIALFTLLLYFVLGTVVTLTHQLKGGANTLGWIVVVIHLTFAIVFGYSYRVEARSR
jgi:uncharacterized membrane protein